MICHNSIKSSVCDSECASNVPARTKGARPSRAGEKAREGAGATDLVVIRRGGVDGRRLDRAVEDGYERLVALVVSLNELFGSRRAELAAADDLGNARASGGQLPGGWEG